MIQLLCYILGVLFGLFFFYFAIISILENEKRAALRSFILAMLIPILYLLMPYIIIENADLYSKTLVSLSVVFGISLFFPIKPKISRKNETPLKRYDERDIMFTRKELIPGSENFEDFYKRNPDKKRYDDIFRRKAGLLSDKASMFDPYSFAARASPKQNLLVSGDSAPIRPERCTICTPSSRKIRSRSKSVRFSFLPTSPARSLCTLGPLEPKPLSAIFI